MRLILAAVLAAFSVNLTATSVTTDSLHLDWLDKNIDPSKNFFAYANGGWQKQHAIPAAYARWDNFHVLHENNSAIIKNILITAENHSATADVIQQKVGDFYFSGMDEKTINAVGVTPLQPEFDRINQIHNLKDFQSAIAHLHTIGVDALFGFGQMQDFKDNAQVIAVAGQGGISLPDRDYYLKKDNKFLKIRQAYVQHVIKMFELLGDDEANATQHANSVMTIETSLAQASVPLVLLRDPRAVYHPMNLAQLSQTTPNFSWQQYFAEMHHPELTHINLSIPTFFVAMNQALNKVSLSDWKIYLRWHVINSFAPYLSKPFVDENFKMVSVLTGATEQLPRWKRVISAENGALGFAIGKLYIEKNFSAASKKTVQAMVANMRAALKRSLEQASWMDMKTRQAALQKLAMMEARVGYPDKWWDYSALKIDRGVYVLNVMRASEFFTQRELNKIGKPVDKQEWDMTPQTINAYYDPSMNRLNIPAGILQPPFFDPNASDAINYGAIGFVIGHEMTHGFDDEGAQFDGVGNLKNWWTSADLKKFQDKTQLIAKQFSQYTVNGQHVQGKLVVGEAAADLGGLTLAYHALHALDGFKHAKTIHGFTPDQQFFLSAAHVWASNVRPQEAQRLVVTDPHPPALYRVNGTLANMLAFQMAYNVPQRGNRVAIFP